VRPAVSDSLALAFNDRPTDHRRKAGDMLLFLALLILVLALGGGIFLSKFLFLLLLIAVIVAVFSRRTA
jgi:hypothetical protein